MKNHFVNYLTAIIMLFNVMAIFYVAFIAYFPFHVIDIQPQPYTLQSTEIQAGSYIYYTFHYCKNYNVQAEIIHQLSGNAEIRLDSTIKIPDLNDQTIHLDQKCGTTTKAVYIPIHTPVGEYVLTEYVDYQVTPLQKREYVFTTEPFTVTKRI